MIDFINLLIIVGSLVVGFLFIFLTIFIKMRRKMLEYQEVVNFLKKTAGYREYLIITNYKKTIILRNAIITRDSIAGEDIIAKKMITISLQKSEVPILEYILDAGSVSFLFASDIVEKTPIIEVYPLFKPDEIIKISSFSDFLETLKDLVEHPITSTINEMKDYIKSLRDLANTLNVNAQEVAKVIGAWAAVDDNILTSLVQGFNEATSLEITKSEFPDFLKRRLEIIKQRFGRGEENES